MKMLQIVLEDDDEDERWLNGTSADLIELHRMACTEAREHGMKAVSVVSSNGKVKLFETAELGGPSADVDALVEQGVLLRCDDS